MIPWVPNAFALGANLDIEKVNDNIEAIYRYIKRSMDRRYTYSHQAVVLDGATNSSAAVLRQIAIRRPAASYAVEVYAVECVLTCSASVTATVSCSDTDWPSFSFDAVSATESYGSSNIQATIPSTSNVTFTVSLSGAATITGGKLIIHTRGDRHNVSPGAEISYTPTLLLSSYTDPAGLLTDANGILDKFSDATALDTANDRDMRAITFSARSIAAGASRVMRLPSGATRIYAITGYVVAAATETVTFTAVGNTTSLSVAVVGTGATSLASGVDVTGGGTENNDPLDSTDDVVLTMSAAGVTTTDLAYMTIWFT